MVGGAPSAAALFSSAMAKGPRLYPDIGKKARGLLYEDHQTEHIFTLTTLTSGGVAITSTGFQKGDSLFVDVSTKPINKNITTKLLKSLKDAFQTSGVDLSQANISVQLDIRNTAINHNLSAPVPEGGKCRGPSF